jgi:hypothetical protein
MARPRMNPPSPRSTGSGLRRTRRRFTRIRTNYKLLNTNYSLVTKSPRLDRILIASDTQSHKQILAQMLIKTLLFIGLTISIQADSSSNLPATTPEIDFANHRFSPQTLVVPAGQPLQIKVVNSSREKIEFESFSLNREKVIGPGESITVRLPALRAGRYDFFDDFHQDVMEGTIRAESAKPDSANIERPTSNIQRPSPDNKP